ncbi:MAG: serine/threonine-protein phosphatase [Bacteroidales bacterium]|nr:serine/threonine-protein phosphatase [Bacteroidales bacterium]
MATFKLFAGTDIGLRDNNEDNFTVCPDLTNGEWVIPSDPQTVIPLGQNGCLLVVADGMGGQNAGEVASAIAISTVQEMFVPANLTESVVSKADSARNFMKKVIVEADRRVKKHSSTHREAEGMGSTIVMAWLLGNNIHIAWVGDSRAYYYSPKEGLKRLSKDHSYVQKLVDEGKLTEQQAMEHPDSNIITRSLGDTSQKAKPDAATYPVQPGEIILLCSDGLCGFCSDDLICGIVSQNQNDLPTCKEVLTEAALNADGSDNITIALLQVVQTDSKRNIVKREEGRGLFTNILLFTVAAFILLSLCFAGHNLIFPKQDDSPVVSDFIFRKDSIPEDSVNTKVQQHGTKGKDLQRQPDIINDANKTGGTETTNSDVSIKSEDSLEPTPVEDDVYESSTPNLNVQN